MRILRNSSSAHLTGLKVSAIVTTGLRQVVAPVVVAFLGWVAVAPSVWSQAPCELAYTFDGEDVGHRFGQSVSGAGDVNNDGCDDLIVGARGAGRAYVYSGATGALLWTFNGEEFYGGWFGSSVSGAGDVNNDSFHDLIIGDPLWGFGSSELGRAYVYSGATAALLWTFTGDEWGDHFGGSVSGAGDVNNDGFADLIVGATGSDVGAEDAGRAYVYSGQTGARIYTWTGSGTEEYFGKSVSGAGDVNNDGFADLIVGAPNNHAAGIYSGRAYVYSGQTGIWIYQFVGGENTQLGWSVSGAGDVDNDGLPDMIVGVPYYSVPGYATGAAVVYSGATGLSIRFFVGQGTEDRFGMSVSGVGDVSNDGYADLIVGAWQNDAGGEDAGRAYLYSGRTSDRICTFTGEAEGDYLGYSVSGAGDVNNDGYDDLIVGAHGHGWIGRAYVYTTGPLCGGCNGDGVINLADVVCLINYVLKAGPPPIPLCIDDVDCNGEVDISDVVHLIDYLYRSGEPPCPDCCP